MNVFVRATGQWRFRGTEPVSLDATALESIMRIMNVSDLLGVLDDVRVLEDGALWAIRKEQRK